jgi:acyl-CoA thioesterase-1
MPRFLFVVMFMLISLPAMAKPVILVVGDSISAGYGIDSSEAWVALLQKKLIKIKSPYSISNASISGEISEGGLVRIIPLLATDDPDIVLLQLGANDGLRGLSPVKMKNNLAEIIQRSQKSGAKVILLGMKIPPNYGKRYVDMFYNVYPQLAKELNIPLVPFLLEDVALNKDLMQADGLHPNVKAQAILAEKIEPYLFPLIK